MSGSDAAHFRSRIKTGQLQSLKLPEETADISDNASVEELQEKLRVLHAKNKQLRQAAYEPDRESTELRKKLEHLNTPPNPIPSGFRVMPSPLLTITRLS